MILSEEGDVRPCEFSIQFWENIRETDYKLDPIWKGQLVHQHRQTISDTCFCTFETCVRTTMVFQPKWIFQTLRKGMKQLQH